MKRCKTDVSLVEISVCRLYYCYVLIAASPVILVREPERLINKVCCLAHFFRYS